MEPTTADHLDADTLAAYVDGRLALTELGAADRHIDACRSCRLELSTLAAIHTQPALPAGDAPEGRLGRYHVLRELGRGSMGIVLRAFDPELARPVAIKLVHQVDGTTRELLRREARALAKLRHPNVVTVYDVIVEADALYVAMELVDGDTLRGFARGKPPGEILDACIRAGRGLAAAHAADVVHRDFKPENVLCSRDGEVRVSDFGLARAADDNEEGGVLCGTPAYMAPEVLRREPATAASDQYSYCLSVYEMLAGKRPPGGDAQPHGAIASHVLRALRRGLERDPAARFPSMDVLVAALADNPRARRHRYILLAAGGAAALATGALAMQLAQRDEATCAIDDATAWTTDRRAAVTRALTASADADIAARAIRSLDEHAARWAESRRDGCMRKDPHHAACLARTRQELDALTNTLAGADTKLANNAQEAIAKLTDPAACSRSTEAITDDPAQRARVEAARNVIARATALQYAGQHAEADALASAAAIHPEPHLVAQALFVRARAASDRGDHDKAEQLLFEALHAAERGRDDTLVATLWVEIVATTGAQKHRFDLAMSNARAADAALARIEPGPDLQLRYAYAYGTLLYTHGKLDIAKTRLEQGLAVAGTEPRRQAQVGLIELALCDIERQLGKLPVAKERCTNGVARLEEALGPAHLRLGISLSIAGALAFTERDLATAERVYMRSVDILEKRNAREHYAYALALSNLGAVYSERNEIEKAEGFYKRSLAMFDTHHPTHPQRLMPLQGLAGLALRVGDATRAIPFYVQIRDQRAATYAPEHSLRLAADYNLALAYRSAKQNDDAAKILAGLATNALQPGKEQWTIAARALDLQGTLASDRKDYAASLAFRERALAAVAHVPESTDHAFYNRHLGETYVYMKKPDRAIAPLEAAITTFEKRAGDIYDLGTSRFLLGRALFESGRDRKRAIELMKQADADLAKAKGDAALAVNRRNIERYLKKYGGR